MSLIQGNSLYSQPSFSLGNRVRRASWGLVWALLFLPTPRPLHRWRAGLLRLFGAHLGQGCRVYPQVRIWAPWNLELGDHVVIGNGAQLYSMGRVSIGDFAIVSQGAHLCAGTHDYNSPNFQLVTKPISIGKQAWICAEAFIHPGVQVAEGVVVGARAVVHKDLAVPWTVHGGNPCRQVGVRTPHEPPAA